MLCGNAVWWAKPSEVSRSRIIGALHGSLVQRGVREIDESVLGKSTLCKFLIGRIGLCEGRSLL